MEFITGKKSCAEHTYVNTWGLFWWNPLHYFFRSPLTDWQKGGSHDLSCLRNQYATETRVWVLSWSYTRTGAGSFTVLFFPSEQFCIPATAFAGTRGDKNCVMWFSKIDGIHMIFTMSCRQTVMLSIYRIFHKIYTWFYDGFVVVILVFSRGFMWTLLLAWASCLTNSRVVDDLNSPTERRTDSQTWKVGSIQIWNREKFRDTRGPESQTVYCKDVCSTNAFFHRL